MLIKNNKKFYYCYHNAKRRCESPSNNRYYIYGGRNIKFKWETYEDFVLDMFNEYKKHVSKYGEKNTQLDRINNDKNYCKENCRFATLTMQANNKSTNKHITFKGVTKTQREWERSLGLKRGVIYSRIKLGWNIGDALKCKNNKY